MTRIDHDEAHDVRRRFSKAVNLTADRLEDWLGTDESQSVGVGEGESVGHESGRRIVEVLRRGGADAVTDREQDDLEFLRKVAGYVARHSQQRPEGDVTQTRWRYSLMNWGHDPLED